MKVVHLLKTGNYSGAEKVVISIIEGLRADESIECIYVSVSGAIDDILLEKNIKHYMLKRYSFFELKKMVSLLQPDIIHAHDFTNVIYGAFLFSRAKRVGHIHNNPPWIKNASLKTLSFLLSTLVYNKLIFVSKQCLEEYVYSKLIKKKSCILINPINSEDVRKLASVGKYAESDLLFIGRLTEQKNPLLFIDIVSEIYRRNHSLSAVMVGMGELYDQCVTKIKRLGLEDVITLVGFCNNPYGYMLHTKVVCVPSKWEGFGLVVPEAFALGKPFVGSPVGGMKALLSNEAGALCENKFEFVSCIERLLTDEVYYDRKHKFCLKISSEMDNYDDYIIKMRNIYERM